MSDAGSDPDRLPLLIRVSGRDRPRLTRDLLGLDQASDALRAGTR